MTDKKDLPPGLRRRIDDDEQEAFARADALERAQHDETVVGSDRALESNRRQEYSGDADAAKKNFDQKLYLFPESFNALRRELDSNWPTLFNTVDPATGYSLAWCMVFKAEEFISILNGALDLMVQMDSDNVDAICKTFLDALREKRGVSRLN
jgi:hypothetical protein